MTTQPAHANRLIHATSPYLLQHAHNPVDWYEWGAEAFAKAEREDKPIFLSIGYAACHWCHVMEHESFETEAVAAVLNEHFVSIKVDREERPDVDEIYMHYTVQRTGHGGWPMSVFLTPQRVPFWAGTYFPRDPFIEVCRSLAQAWENQRDKIVEHAGEVDRFLKEWAAGETSAQAIPPRETIARAARFFADRFDPEMGGYNTGGNKFPPSMAMELMLREYVVSGDERLKHLVMLTLDHMAQGGIYDHLGGGICRYSTDPQWLVPHFEKMLYDQALVSSIYLDAFQATGKQLYARVARDIFDYVIRDLQSPEGGFYSTRDADSEGLEGKYYLWTVEQVREILGETDAKLFCEIYDVTPSGNWIERLGHAPSGPKNILNLKQSIEEFAADRHVSPEALEIKLTGMRTKLLEARSQRVPPALDDKILAGWNGLMIASLAKGSRVLDDDRFADAAARAADFVLTRMRENGRLLCTYRAGRAHLTAYLTDYAYLIEGLLNLYEATFEARWLVEATRLNEVLTTHYYDPQNGGYFFTADNAEKLVARTKSPTDSAIPSGNSVQAANLLRMALYFDNADHRTKADSIFRAFGEAATQSPFTYERFLSSLDFRHGEPLEIVLAGRAADPGFRTLISTLFRRFIPNKIVAGSLIEEVNTFDDPVLPLLINRAAIEGRATAYVCRQRVCKKPVTTAVDLAAVLDGR